MTPTEDISVVIDKLRFSIAPSSLGSLLVARSDQGICAILFGASEKALTRELQNLFPEATLVAVDGREDDTVAQVTRFVESPETGLALPIDLWGNDFERRVWNALRDIPPGTTATYGEIANRIGAPATAFDVGQACAANKLAVAIPCHRILKSDGSLSGYRWGSQRKRALLAREGARSPG